jgi:hypothetical protein
MADARDQLLILVKQKGPCLPSDVYKELNTNQLFASAMLGELVSAGIIKVTNLKRGSSPYYYVDEQKEKLQNLVQYLNDKDRMAFNLIKDSQILKDLDQTPLMRVALRSIKDYAVPLNINFNNQIQTFWKWYLLSNQEAEIKIKQFLGILPKETKKEEKIEEQRKITQIPAQQKEEIRKEPTEKPQTKPKIPQDVKTPFLDELTKYFSKNNITVLNQEITNKSKTEIDFIIELPSPVGKLQYYCKAKDKKKIADGDIASAFVQGQQKRLPVLLLINGTMTKKAQEMLTKEFKGLTVYKI